MFWLSRRAWPALGIVALSMALGATLLCLVPLAAQASLTRALQQALGSPYENTIVVSATLPASQDIPALTQQLDARAARTLTATGALHAGLALRSQDIQLSSQAGLHLKAYPLDYLAQQFTLVAGSWPSDTTAANEIALTVQTARQLRVTVGETLVWRTGNPQRSQPPATVTLLVDGIVEPHTAQSKDPYDTEPVDPLSVGADHYSYAALTTTSVYARVARTIDASAPAPLRAVQAMWVYQIPPQAVNADNYMRIQAQAQSFSHLGAIFARIQASNSFTVYGNAIPTLAGYDNREAEMRLPLTAIAAQIAIALLWFLIATTEMLLAREEQTLIILRSRGATVWQALMPLLACLIPIAMISFLLGPYLATLVINAFGAWPRLMLCGAPPLNASGLGALFATVGWYSGAMSVIALAACTVALASRLRLTIVEFRRRESWNRQRSFWRRYPLDLVLAVALLLVYFSYTLLIAPSLSSTLATQMAPLAVYMPILALSAAMLVLFRLVGPFFGVLARVSKLAHGVTPVLAALSLRQAQLRSRQASIFLALAVALLSFLLAYQATLTQHNQDYAAFQVGADVSFALPIDINHNETASEQESRYRRIPGVQAASAGAIIDVTSPTDAAARDRILAVDAGSFGAVAAWPAPASSASQRMNGYLALMLQERGSAESAHVVPALLDAAMLREYHLSPGDTFTLAFAGDGSLSVTFQVLGTQTYLPMITDVPGGGDQSLTGGMLVDFPTLAQVITQSNPQDQAPPGYMWLRVAHGSASIAQVRHALTRAPYTIAGAQDRFQLAASMAADPLSTAMVEVITVGGTIILLLALIVGAQMIGNALERRVVSLSALYALGASRLQIMATSAGESIAELCAALVIGLTLGVTLTLIAAPLIVFAQSSDTGLSVNALQIPPPQVIFPIDLLLKGGAIACVTAAIAIMLAARSRVLRSVAAHLRLNED